MLLKPFRILSTLLVVLGSASLAQAQAGSRDRQREADRREQNATEKPPTRSFRYPPPIGKPHPPLALWDLKHEQSISITKYRGKKVLLIHFATWSRACRDAVPKWYEALQKHVDTEKLVIVGIVQEQHPDRAALFAQWKKITGPLLQDPVDYMQLKSVPLFVCIDENGYVRSAKPELETIEKKFINRKYPGKPVPIPENTEEPPNTVVTRRYAHDSRMPADLFTHGEALILAGLPPQIEEAIESYEEGLKKDKKNARGHFGLGVAYRMRYDSAEAKPGDLKAAIDAWTKTVELAPKNEIYRERLNENTPSEKGQPAPYAWIRTARKAITDRGETPEPLVVDPFSPKSDKKEDEHKDKKGDGANDEKKEESKEK